MAPYSSGQGTAPRIKVIPTVFSTNEKEFYERLRRLAPLFKELQIDFMDGRFVPSASITATQLPDLKKYPVKWEAHLMVEDPVKFIPSLKKRGFSRVFAHIEALKTPEIVKKFFDVSAKAGLEAGLAINPETPMKFIAPFLSRFSMLLVLGVHPGKEGKGLIPAVLGKIKKIKAAHPDVLIQVDGGVNPKTAYRLGVVGVTQVNAGSFISNSSNPQKAAELLLAKMRQGAKNVSL